MLLRNAVMNALTFVSVATFSTHAMAALETFAVDPAHSRVGFSVRHLMISEVQGSFKEFEGKFKFDAEKGAFDDAEFVVKTKTVNTENEKRDEHLRQDDFFNAEKFPVMKLKTKSVKKEGKDKFKWNGELTIRDVTKPVTFDVEYRGQVKDPWGNTKAGFVATGKINRQDFGLKWNKTLDAGGVAVGDEVKIQIDVEAQVEKAEKKDAKTEKK